MHWISHRGVKKSAAENSMSAFKEARKVGFTSFETDLRLTKDGHIVLTHDRSLKRLLGEDVYVDELTRHELSKFKFPPTGEGFLYLDEFLREFTGFSWTFDIKRETALGVIDALDQLAKAIGGHDLIMAQAKFLTWERDHEAYLKRFFPNAVCYAREKECWRAGLAVLLRLPWLAGIKAGRTYSVPPFLGGIGLYKSWIVQKFHQRGAKVLAFLPKTSSDVANALSSQFDEVLSDYPPSDFSK